MFIEGRYSISDKLIWMISGFCLLPLLLHLVGVNFGFINGQLHVNMINRLVEFENQRDLQEVLKGRYVHTIFVSASITIALLTIILAFFDYRIKSEPSTLVVGVALFCAGLFYAFHILVSTNLIHVPNQQFYLTSFTWFFCRVFHASILILGVGILMVFPGTLKAEDMKGAKNRISILALVFILITCVTIIILFLDTNIPKLVFPYRNIARPYDLIPLALYGSLTFYLLPKFYVRYPSVFSGMLILSMIPAIASQFYMAFGSEELFDNNFNISHFMTAVSFFIPFIGLSLNYLQANKNEMAVIEELNREAEEKKAVQEMLSGVLNSSLNSIMALTAVKDSEEEIIDFEWQMINPAGEHLFQTSGDELIGARLSEQFPDLQDENWMQMLADVVISGESLNHEYYSDHFGKWLLLIGVKLNEGVALTVSDISRRKKALQELMSAEKLAVTGRLTRTIAHEVRNPLTNINLSVEQMKESTAEDNAMYMEIIQRNANRINQLITELLNSSRPGDLELTNCKVDDLVEETIALANDRIQLKEIQLEKKYQTNEAWFKIDISKMKTALLNLIINAVEAMEQGHGKLTVSTLLVDHFCQIIIEDNGSGIEPEHLKTLFDPFFSNKKSGMGLGLTSTEGIVHSHKGMIEVQSKRGFGSRFVVSLPLGDY